MTCQTTVHAAFKVPCLYPRLCSSGTGKVLPFRVSDYLVQFAGGGKGIDSELKKVTLRHGEEVEQRINNLSCKESQLCQNLNPPTS